MSESVRRTIPIAPVGLDWLRAFVADTPDVESMSATVRSAVTAYLDDHDRQVAAAKGAERRAPDHRRAPTKQVEERLRGRVTVIASRAWWDRLAAAAESQRGLAQHDVVANALNGVRTGRLELTPPTPAPAPTVPGAQSTLFDVEVR